MGDNSAIEWTEATWNPIRGCSLVSDGCRNCYAMKVAHRFSGPGQPYEGLTVLGSSGPRWNGKVMVVEEHMEDPLRWTRPRRIFVNSMSDLFHEDVSQETIERILAVMVLTPHHTYQVLTKRPKRMQLLFTYGHSVHPSIMAARVARAVFVICEAHGWDTKKVAPWAYDADGNALAPLPWPLPNLWLGVSVEDQATADERIPLLIETPAAVRWVSAEPLLGPINFHPFLCKYGSTTRADQRYSNICLPAGNIHWIVAGGESGPGARVMHPDWVRQIQWQCADTGVAFFFKQWGAYDADGKKVGKKAAGRELGGRTYDEYPLRPCEVLS